MTHPIFLEYPKTREWRMVLRFCRRVTGWDYPPSEAHAYAVLGEWLAPRIPDCDTDGGRIYDAKADVEDFWRGWYQQRIFGAVRVLLDARRKARGVYPFARKKVRGV